MPKFDPDGGDMWTCQGPRHKGDRLQRSRVESQWRPDITGHESTGNCCPTCIREHDGDKQMESRRLTIRYYKDPNFQAFRFEVKLDGQLTLLTQDDSFDRLMRFVREDLDPEQTTIDAVIEWLVDLDTEKPSMLHHTMVKEVRQEEILNPLDYADNPAELEVQQELRRTGIRNAPQPTCCPECKGPLQATGGMVGESVLVCSNHGIVWEDAEDAIRRVL